MTMRVTRLRLRTRLGEARLWLLVLGLGLVRTERPSTLTDRLLEQFLKIFVPKDNSIVTDSLPIVDTPDTTIVLLEPENRHKSPLVIYPTGLSEADLPECGQNEVCNKVDMYSDPWVERQCRCTGGRTCSRSLHADDGHTIVHKNHQYKLCEPVTQLPICQSFKNITWIIRSRPEAGPNNRIVQKHYCRCRNDSVAYLVKKPLYKLGTLDVIYKFVCSTKSIMKCEPKEPCRLFTVHKRQNSQLEEVEDSTLCQCREGFQCPKRHTDPNSIYSTQFGDKLDYHVYSGHCYQARQSNKSAYTLG